MWKDKINAFKKANQHLLSKGDFTGVFGKALTYTFTSKTIKAAFKATSVYLYNDIVITETQMKSSLPILIKGSFLLS